MDDYRKWLTLSITSLALVGIVVLSIVTIVNAKDSKEVSDAAEKVLAVILPIISGWVATILTYYYTKDMAETAYRSANNLAMGLTPKGIDNGSAKP